MDRPQSPLDIFCRGCGSQVGEKCVVVPRRHIRNMEFRGRAEIKYQVREVRYFHDMRWRDFNRVRNDWAKLDDWQKRYGAA